MIKTVWKAKLDNRYVCEVLRGESPVGTLTITDGNKILHRQDVDFYKDRNFGASITEWKAICKTIVDA